MLSLENHYHIALLAAAAIATWRWCRRPRKAISCLCIYVLYGLLNEWATQHSIREYQNNYILANLYDHLSLILLLRFYQQSFPEGSVRRALGIMTICCVTGLVVSLLLMPGFRLQHQTDLEHIRHMIIIMISLYTVYRLVIADERGLIHQQFLFWVSLQFIGYHFICLWCRSVVHPFNLESETVLAGFFDILLMANTLHYALLALLLILFKKNTSPAL